MMKYGIRYLFADKGQRPEDPGPLEWQHEDHVPPHLLPNVGECVHVGATPDNGDQAENGRVRSRTFFYQEAGGETFCTIVIVVERDQSINWGLLTKD